MNPIVFSLTVFSRRYSVFLFSLCLPFASGLYWNLAGSDQEKGYPIVREKIRWHGLLKPFVLLPVFLLFSSSLVLERACLERSCTPIIPYLMGALIIILGLHQMEVLHFHFLWEAKISWFWSQQTEEWIVFCFFLLLGLGFSFGWTPCIGPVLGSVHALAASDGQDAYGELFISLVYTLGMALPFLLLALAPSLVLPYFVSQTPFVIAEENGGSHHYSNGNSLTFGTIEQFVIYLFIKIIRRYNTWWKVYKYACFSVLSFCCQLVPWINPVRVVWTISQQWIQQRIRMLW